MIPISLWFLSLTLVWDFQPVSMMNDRQILTIILSNRLQKVATALVNLDKVGFIWGQQRSDNLRLVTDLIALNNKRSDQVAVLSLSTEKLLTKCTGNLFLLCCLNLISLTYISSWL